MRKSALHLIAATLLVAAPAAHASVFSSSAASSEHAAEKSSTSLTLLEQVGNFLNVISFKVSAEEADDTTADQGCKDKTAPKKASKNPSGSTPDEEDAKPTGPEPIYFGF